MTTRSEAIAAAGAVLREAWLDMAESYARGGAIAVAEAAYVPGGPSVEELAAKCERQVQEYRAREASEAA